MNLQVVVVVVCNSNASCKMILESNDRLAFKLNSTQTWNGFAEKKLFDAKF